MDLAKSVNLAAQWRRAGKTVAAATLVRSQGPAPRPLGSRFLMSSEGDLEGSVSGGCVESDVFLHTQKAMTTGVAKLVEYGISDEEAFEVGLSCGGHISVFIEPSLSEEVDEFVKSGETGAIASLVGGPHLGEKLVFDSNGSPRRSDLPSELIEAVGTAARDVIRNEKPQYLAHRDSEVFIEAVAPPPRLVIFGAVDIGRALSALAARAGFEVTVCDPRSAFATPERFPDAAVIARWPDQALEEVGLDDRTYVVVLSHDPRYEDPVLKAALSVPVRYIGAMGSRKTHKRRIERLAAGGVPPELLGRINGPIGLNLGAGSAEETAVEILGEMIKVRRTGDAGTAAGRSDSV